MSAGVRWCVRGCVGGWEERLVWVHPDDGGAPGEGAPRALLEQGLLVGGEDARRRRVEAPRLQGPVLQAPELLRPALVVRGAGGGRAAFWPHLPELSD